MPWPRMGNKDKTRTGRHYGVSMWISYVQSRSLNAPRL